MERGLLGLALGENTAPKVDDSVPGSQEKLDAWKISKEKAAGIIRNSLDATQQAAVYEHRRDPVALKKKLKDKHQPSDVGYRVRAIDLMLTMKFDEASQESAQEYLGRVRCCVIPSGLQD